MPNWPLLSAAPDRSGRVGRPEAAGLRQTLEYALSQAKRAHEVAGWGDREAHAAVQTAERDLAAFDGRPYAQVLDLGVRWSGGAPLPHVVSDGSTAIVVCHLDVPDPDWDGSYVTVVSPADEDEAPFAVITFTGCAGIRFGAPNDEALSGHPLASTLEYYQAHEVVNSAWLIEQMNINAVHPYHSETGWRELHHYFLVFHDETFEALARHVSTETVTGTLGGLLDQATRRLVTRP